MKQLKELHNFNIALEGDIKEIITDPGAWAEQFAESAILKEVPRYLKAKNLGEKVAREITN